MPTMFDELPRKVFLFILLGSIIFLPVQVQGHAGSDNISHTMANLKHLSGVPDVFSSQWKVRLSGKYFGAAKHFLVFVLALAGAAFMFKEINMGICYSSGADLSMKVAVITGGTRGTFTAAFAHLCLMKDVYVLLPRHGIRSGKVSGIQKCLCHCCVQRCY